MNTGAQFTVRVPIARMPTSVAPPTGESRVVPPGTCRVLVVDDNEDSAQTMAMLLQMTGHAAEMAHDGPSAITTAVRYRPHVVLLDIGLPGMSGYEVARELRGRPETATAVLVAMTGYGQEEDRRRSTEAGFAHHLIKPVDPASLERVIASAPCED
jgi:CheY-like chemotaxis protein